LYRVLIAKFARMQSVTAAAAVYDQTRDAMAFFEQP